jgi:hypothetical protein
MRNRFQPEQSTAASQLQIRNCRCIPLRLTPLTAQQAQGVTRVPREPPDS